MGASLPAGSLQRLRRSLGFRERKIDELDLRVPLGGDDRSVCQVIVDERDDKVYVRVLACCHDEHDEDASREREYLACPVRVRLERPLGARVVNVDTDEELPLFTPRWVDNVPQADHGYRSLIDAAVRTSGRDGSRFLTEETTSSRAATIR